METRDLPSAIIKAISHTNLNRRRLFFSTEKFSQTACPLWEVGHPNASGWFHRCSRYKSLC